MASLIVWLGFGAFTTEARVRFPVRENREEAVPFAIPDYNHLETCGIQICLGIPDEFFVNFLEDLAKTSSSCDIQCYYNGRENPKDHFPYFRRVFLMMHWPGIEPGSTAWEAAMLTSIIPMLECAITTMLLL